MGIARVRLGTTPPRGHGPWTSRWLWPATIGSNDGRCVQMAGTQSVPADDRRLRGIPCSRQTVAIVYPQWDLKGLGRFPDHVWPGLDRSERVTRSPCHCDPRAAQNISEHHRPAVGSSMQLLETEPAPQRSDRRALGSPAETNAGHPVRRDRRPPFGPRKDCPTRCEPRAIGRQMSHSLSESTRQITPPIRSGHAPPSTGSRKSDQSVHPGCVLTW